MLLESADKDDVVVKVDWDRRAAGGGEADNGIEKVSDSLEGLVGLLS